MKSQAIQAVIIGGGVSGLATAYRLQEASRDGMPLSYTLVEASNRFGGKILTEHISGFLIEGGPESFVSYKPWALELCEKLGLTPHLIGTNRDHHRVYTLCNNRLKELPQGLLVPTHLLPFLASGALSLQGKLRMVWDLFLPKSKGEKDESVAAFVRRRLGREALERLVEPLLSGIYAGDVEQMSLRSAFPLFYDLEQEYGSLIRGLLRRQRDTLRRESKVSSPWTTFVTLRDGIGQLVEAWVKQLSVASLISGKRVQEIRPRGPRAYTVLLEGGEILQANAVVLTVPAYAAADLVEGFAPPLAATLREIPYASSATVSIGYRRKNVTHPLDGFGFIVPRVEHRKVLAATWTSTKFPHRVPDGHLLIRCFLGGALNEEILALNDAEMVQMVQRELAGVMGISAEPLLAKVYRWQRATPQYVVGHQARLALMERLLQHYPGLYLTGAAYQGIGIPDCIHQGTLTAERLLSSQQIQR